MSVSRSGYYHWKRRKADREARERAYAEKVRETFALGEGNYGASRICGKLRQDEFPCSFYKVREYMDIQGLRCIHIRRRQRNLTDSRKARGDGYFNLTRNLDILALFEVLSSDISYIRTGEGFDYLCQIKDVMSGVILAESISEHMRADLVVMMIKKAIRRYDIPKGCIFHSDTGSQYTSEEVMNLLAKEGLRQSFSRVGTPGDNSWSESFFANLKKKIVHWTHFQTRAEARQKIFAYVEGLYNTREYRISNYLEASKPKITEEISESESAFLQDQFGISLPQGAEITAFSYSYEVIIIRIDGVEDLPTFLTDSIDPGVAKEKSEIFTEDYLGNSERNTNPLADMYGIEHQFWGICPIDSITSARFFLNDEKLTIEMVKRYYVTENPYDLGDIADK